MLDASIRRVLDGPLRTVGAKLDSFGVTADGLTVAGLALGVGACAAVASGNWFVGLGLWLLNRLADGLDGPTARSRPEAVRASDIGGFFDIMADFAVYGGLLVAIGLAEPDTRLAALVVFLAYYLSGSAFLAWSSLAAARKVQGDGRSLHFPAGLAEGTETILAYVVILAWRDHATLLLWIWAAIVGVTVVQRLVFIRGELR